MGPSFFNRVELLSEKRSLIINVLLGVYFICLQALEYYGARFRIVVRVYALLSLLQEDFIGCTY